MYTLHTAFLCKIRLFGLLFSWFFFVCVIEMRRKQKYWKIWNFVCVWFKVYWLSISHDRGDTPLAAKMIVICKNVLCGALLWEKNSGNMISNCVQHVWVWTTGWTGEEEKKIVVCEVAAPEPPPAPQTNNNTDSSLFVTIEIAVGAQYCKRQYEIENYFFLFSPLRTNALEN